MEPLKEMFNKKFFVALAAAFKNVENKFDEKLFVKKSLEGLESLSLNERMRRTSLILKNVLPDDFKMNINTMQQVITLMPTGYTNLLFPDFVGLYGHDDFDTSMQALRYFTRFGSSEFAIREFLKRDFEKTMEHMISWSSDEDPHVRRLASEGSRARLPWSFKLDEVIKNPKCTKTILENLKADNALYVRKSVANHLNDVSKDNPDYMISLLRAWDQNNPNTAWIIKHASRTLIKKGNAASLSVFNFEKNVKLKIDNLKVNKTQIKLGQTLEFSFDLLSQKNKTQKLVVDYIIHYRKSSTALSPKVFKLKEILLEPQQKISFSKKQLIKDFSTRKHFKGRHLLEIQVNGNVIGKVDFFLEL